MSPEIVEIEGFDVVGYKITTNNRNTLDIANSKIMKLWEKFFNDNLIAQIPEKSPNCQICGVYSDYESDRFGEYSLTAGVKVKSISDNIPEKASSVSVNSGKFLKFGSFSAAPQEMINAWKNIWKYFDENTEYKRAFNSDYEAYVSDAEVDIYISIK